jgi:type IX secretion system PorP/SprF family membrane protein
MKRWIYILILTMAFLLNASAQQAPVYSQYMLNGFLINPAIAGSDGYTALNLTVREQWVGFNGGPSTYALSFQTRLMRESHISRNKQVKRKSKSPFRGGKVGLGGYVFNHTNGALDRTGIKATYAYHLEFDKSQLSFGLSLIGYQYRIDKDRIDLENPDDVLFLNLDESVFIPDADFGVYYLSKTLWGGLSIDQMLQSSLKFGGDGFDNFVMYRNYNLMAGYDFPLNEEYILSPSTYIKVAENGKVQADITARIYYSQSYWVGLTYRTASSLSIGAGVSSERLIFGYAFDMGLNSLMRSSYGTHEFTIIAKLGDVTRRHHWLTRF